MTASGHTSAEAQIRALIETWIDAIRAKDAARATAHQTVDVLIFDLAPPLLSGGADQRGLQAWFSTWQGPLDYEIGDLKVTAGAETAFCHGLSRLRGTKTDGEAVDMWSRQTFGFRKVAGEWRIAHQHESVPFYMDGSYRAAVDLKP